MEREPYRSPKNVKAKVRAKGKEQSKEKTKEQSKSKSTIQPDKRLARIIAQGKGQYQTYNPEKDKTGRGRQNRQFLDKYIKANKTNSAIQKLPDGVYQIDRRLALQDIKKHRETNQSIPLSSKIAKEFRFKGEKQKDGSLMIDPSKLLKNGQERFHNTLVNRLETALANGESGLSQLADGRYRLSSEHVKADNAPEVSRERRPTSKVDQRLARIVGLDIGASMTYDPMKDSSGQASQNTRYLDELCKKNKFVEKATDGRFLIDRYAANQALEKTYKSPSQEQELDPKIIGLFKKYGSQLEKGFHTINPKQLLENSAQSPHYSRVVNTLEKGLREGAYGLHKTEDGTYLLHTGTTEKGPSLTPSKKWEFWRDYHQRDSLKAALSMSPLYKEQKEKGPAPTMSPTATDKEPTRFRDKIKQLNIEQDEKKKKQQQIRQEDQLLAQQQRKKLERQLVTEQMQLNQSLKRNWKAAGVLNVEMKYRADKNQHPLKPGTDLSPSTQAEYQKIARRLENIHPQQMPEYLQKRADQVSRQTWWKEHAVARRLLRSAENQHFKQDEIQQGKKLASIRQDIQKMDYQSNRTKETAPSHSKRLSQFDEGFYEQLLNRTKERGDQELHDALIITRETGLRPEELQKGVSFGSSETNPDVIAIHINGAKKSHGIAEAPERYQGEHGQDRILVVESKSLANLAERHNGNFQPESSKEALRMRLNRATADLDPENKQNFSFYTLRHQAADDLREQGFQEGDIALHMGHQSEQTQEQYGIKHA